jgi:hypothetical protein
MLRRYCGKVVERFVDSGREACSRNIVSKDTLVHHLGEEAGLRGQLMQQVRDILLALRSERLLIPRASAKGNDDDLPLLCRSLAMHKRAAANQSGSQRESSRTAQEVTSG